eukprot:3147942-Alexandrium_andersonii.AAC.1
MHEAALAERERGLMEEAGRRALYLEPLPVAGGAAPCSDDGPDPQALAAAAAAPAPSPPTAFGRAQ